MPHPYLHQLKAGESSNEAWNVHAGKTQLVHRSITSPLNQVSTYLSTKPKIQLHVELHLLPLPPSIL